MIQPAKLRPLLLDEYYQQFKSQYSKNNSELKIDPNNGTSSKFGAIGRVVQTDSKPAFLKDLKPQNQFNVSGADSRLPSEQKNACDRTLQPLSAVSEFSQSSFKSNILRSNEQSEFRENSLNMVSDISIKGHFVTSSTHQQIGFVHTKSPENRTKVSLATESNVVGQLENKPDKNESQTQQISKKAGKPKSSKRVAKIKSKDNSEVRVSSGLKNKKLTKIGDVQKFEEIRPDEKEAEIKKESKLKPKKEKVAKIISLIEISKKQTKIEELKPRELLTLENKKTITPKISRENQTNAGEPLQPTNSPRKTQAKIMQTLKIINQENEITLQNVF